MKIKEMERRIKELKIECMGKPDSRELQDLEMKYDLIMSTKRLDNFIDDDTMESRVGDLE